MSELHVAAGLDLPLQLQTRATVVYGMRGSGKTSCGVVIAEELWDAALQFVVIDPNGAWWGLRSSVDGESAGIPILVMGGQHGNVPLEPEAGEFVADLIVDERVSAVLDLSDFDSNEDQVRFATAFLKRLHQRKKREPDRTGLLVIVDEADEFAPQPGGGTPLGGNYALCVGAVKRIVLRDRRLGVGVLLIAQRAAHLNKSVSDGTDMVIAFRTTGARSIKAVRERLEADHGEPELTEAVSQLGKLEDGEALVSSPSWLKAFGRFRFRMRRTYDAGATPEVGVVTREPRVLAEADVARIRARMAATIEKQKAEDPKLLQARIRDLEKQLAGKAPVAAAPIEKIVEVPVLAESALAEIHEIAISLLDASTKMWDGARVIQDAAYPIVTEMQRIKPPALSAASSSTGEGSRAADIRRTAPEARLSRAHPVSSGDGAAVRAAAPRPASPSTERPLTAKPVRSGEPRVTEGVSPTQQRILDAAALLEHRGAEISVVAIAAVAGVHPNGGRFRGDLRALQSAELLDETYRLTQRGARGAAIDDKIAPNQQKILDLIAMLEANNLEANPKTIAAWLDLNPNGGRFRGDLKHLQTTGLLDGYRLTRAAKRHVNDMAIDALAAAFARLDPSTSRLLQLVRDHPKGLTVSDAAANLNLHPNGGRFRSSIARLAEMGLIRSKSELALSDPVRQAAAA